MLLQAEDDGDAKAVVRAKAEQMAEMAEFDENFHKQDDDVKVGYNYCMHEVVCMYAWNTRTLFNMPQSKHCMCGGQIKHCRSMGPKKITVDAWDPSKAL